MKQKIDSELLQRLYQMLNNAKDQVLQMKPTNLDISQDQFSLFKKFDDLQKYSRDYSSQIDKQIMIIAQNIINVLFSLNNQKYYAVMSRMDVWGYQLTLQQFIKNYYLYIKKDNKLRQFIMNHLQKIINISVGVMDKILIKNMKRFQFNNPINDNNLDVMKKQKKKIEKQLQEVNSDQSQKKIVQTEPQQNDQTTMQQQILNKLKQQHPILQGEQKEQE